MAELLPCPFCGNDDVLVIEERDADMCKFTMIICNKCKRAVREFSNDLARLIWNTRTKERGGEK